MKPLRLFLILLVSSLFINNTFGQTEVSAEVKRALDLYKQGKYSEAVSMLQSYTKANKQDAEGFNLLGISYLGLNKPKDGRKALETAATITPQDAVVRKNLAYAFLLENKLDKAISESTYALQLSPQNVDLFYIRGKANLWKGGFDEAISDADKIIALNNKLSNAYLLKAYAYSYKFGDELGEGEKPGNILNLLNNTVTTLDECLKTCTESKDLAMHAELKENTTAFIKYFEKHKDGNFPSVAKSASKKKSKDAQATAAPATPDPTVTPIKIMEKPRPSYTNSARAAQVEGTITVAVLFSANGKIAVIVLNGLSNGLTEEAVAAAKKIKFEPQLKDGKPVSVVKTLIYSFDMY